jgi:tRNA pseudouridine65 synthase
MGIHVHPPEFEGIRIRRSQNGLALLRDQIGRYLYPVHRLDAATSGVLVYALQSEAAARLQTVFRDRKARKTYEVLVRGHAPSEGAIDRALKRDHGQSFADARTRYRLRARATFEISTRRYPQSRLSWLEVHPETGVFHQIRRHLAGISHPILGDSVHGDGEYNRILRERLGLPGLWLRATSLVLPHPVSGEPLELRAPECPRWEAMRAQIAWEEV